VTAEPMININRNWAASGAAIAMLVVSPAHAQRTDDNAVTQADDAFGKSVGGDSIGIYNPYDVRGFSPVDAGNVRIEGLYFDQQSNPTDRLVDGNTIRVGISAQGYPFPAPTGIADYSLRRAGAKPLAALALNYGPFGGKSVELDTQLPIDGERLGITAGVGLYREVNPFQGTPHFLSLGVTGRYHPAPGIEIMPFWSSIKVREDESQSLIFTTDGTFLPPRIPRRRFLGQKWADFGANTNNYGVVARADPFGFDVRFGMFRSVNDALEDHLDLLFDTDRTGRVGTRVAIIGSDSAFASTSGELRVSRKFDEGPRRHTVIASVRGRKQARRYGGEDSITILPSLPGATNFQLGVQDFVAEPAAVFGAKTTDRVTQSTFGLAYQGMWRDVGELSLGMQKTRYSKAVNFPDPLVIDPPTSRSSPLLLTANAALYVTKSLALYGGYTRGLEESPVAPFEALNRNEAPPAILTRQKEAGIRWAIGGKIKAVVGVFDIAKPYFNLDGVRKFRQLGRVQHRGVELSVSGEVAPGVNVVVGNLFLDAAVSGEEVASGAIGKRPIGATKRHTIVSLNYVVPGFDPLSFDANFEGTSNRTANAANTLVIPTRAVMSLGARYKFKVDQTPALLRLQVQNVTNTFGWNVGSSGFFVPNGARRWLMVVAADI
jgi:iron complex outermembrane recepter protein